MSSGEIWALLCYVEYVHAACSLQGSPGSKDGGLELGSRVANAAGRARARARLIEKSDLNFWKSFTLDSLWIPGPITRSSEALSRGGVRQTGACNWLPFAPWVGGRLAGMHCGHPFVAEVERENV